jgi:SAM-dependent methyltransferase
MNTTTETSIFGRLGALADANRSRLLLLLDRQELTVSELCGIVQLPQSTVSRQLRVLAEEGWVVSRADGTSRYYRRATRLEENAARLWEVVRAEVAATPAAGEDEARTRGVLARRRARSETFFTTAAGEWDALRAELFGARPERLALLGLLDAEWMVGDLGCGTGQLAETVAPFVGRVIAVDRSDAMLAAARARLEGVANVELRQGELEALPVADGELDAAVVFLVLHYVLDPARALEEAFRTLRPGGRLLIVDMAVHGRAELRDRMGHVWPGFGEEELRGWVEGAGFEAFRYIALPPSESSNGPLLFAAAARRRG